MDTIFHKWIIFVPQKIWDQSQKGKAPDQTPNKCVTLRLAPVHIYILNVNPTGYYDFHKRRSTLILKQFLGQSNLAIHMTKAYYLKYNPSSKT